MNKFQILVVEDDPPIRNLIATTLKTHEYKYLLAKNGEEAILQASSYAPDVVFLDLGLPDIDGIEIIKRIREWSNMPIIVISARSEDEDKIEALDAGADDYLTKPFSVEELLARLRVMQRRIALLKSDSEINEKSVYTNGRLKIDYAAGCAYIEDAELKLTPIEYKLLCLLAQNTGKVLTHKYITQKIWGSAWDSNVASLRVFMATLRKKLEDENASVVYIQTETLDDAFIRIAELERENEALLEELAYYKNRKMSGRRKHNAKWQAIYKDFVEGYEDGMAMVDIAKRNHVSERTIYRYKAYYDKVKENGSV